MEAELRQAIPHAHVELVAGSGGIFDVEVDGKLLFSKKRLSRFPEEGEIAELIRQQVEPRP